MEEVKTFKVCPACGSGKVQEGRVCGDAGCLDCGWKGRLGELMEATADDTMIRSAQGIIGNPDLAMGIAEEVSKGYLQALAAMAAQNIGLAMLQSGVIGRDQPKELTRLIRAACLAAHKGTLIEIEAIQKELQNEQRGTDN